MAIKELAPHISCLCNEEDFEEAKARFSELYVLTTNGVMKYVKLKYDRYICVKVDEVPSQTSVLKEELRFLPAGKIPYRLFEQIVAFFKKVIEVKKSSVEAHVHILWNPTQGYYLSVPNQKVSAASVSYDFSHVGKDDVIVADWHSHNSMGAFYSGTDNNDDKNKTYYTGVIGKLNQPRYEYVLRFNYNELKRDCDLDEIFEINAAEAEVPDSWLEQIQTHSYQYSGKGGGKNKGKNNDQRGLPFDPDDPDTYMGMMGFGYGGSADDWKSYIEEREKASGKGTPPSNTKSQESYGKVLTGANSSLILLENKETSRFQEMTLNPKTGLLEPSESLEEQNTANQQEQERKQETEEIPRYTRKSKGVNQQDPCYMDYLTAQYGDDVANGYDQAAAGLMDLDGADEPLLDIIREAYSRLSTSAQMELGQTGF